MSLDEKNVSWPGWEVVRLIGRGSFGTVYKIQRDVLGSTEKAALKVISIPQNASDIDEMYSNGYDEESITNTFKFHLKSIVEEYSMMRKLSDCPNIVSCDDVRYIQHDDGIGWDIYIKMELLTPLLKSFQGPVSEETIIKLAKDICSALVVCKQHNIIHRDIKPQNIFLAPSGIYKLGDFGIAKTVEKTMGGTKIGTYNYMAPEVYNNKPYSSAADIYSLGLVLYWLLNERRMPFLPLPPAKLNVGMDETARNRRLSGERFGEPKNGSKELKTIVMKACAYHVEDRYSSASEMIMDLSKLDCKYVKQPVGAPLPSYSSEIPFRAITNEDEMDRTVGIFGNMACGGEVIPEIQREVDTVSIFSTQGAKKQYEYTTVSEPDINTEEAPMVVEKTGEFDTNQGDIQTSNSGTYTDRRKETPAPEGHKMTLPVKICIVVIFFSAVALFFLFQHKHTWRDATCTTPKTCSECYETEGSELGHQIMAATCDSPEQCTRCGETFGMALGHTWMDATCKTPKTCSICGAVSGELGHQWNDATYFQPKICQLCGATEGAKLVPDPVYINELDYCDKYGKLWTMSEQTPSYYVHTDVNDAEGYKDMSTQGHTTGSVYDYLGNAYTYGLHIDGAEYSAYYISYNIGGIYSTFTGVCSMSQEMDGDPRASSNSKYFEVYGDGVLLFRSLDISQGSAPQKFSIDVSGVEILTIRYPKTSGPSRIATVFDGKLS